MSYEGAAEAITFLGLGLFLWAGAKQVLAGQLTIGGLVAFNSLVTLATVPIHNLLTLWDTLQRVSSRLFPGSATVPLMMFGATDARFFRRVGAVAYGFGLFSQRISFDEFSSMFHGDNERVDQDSLRLSTELWEATARDLLHG